MYNVLQTLMLALTAVHEYMMQMHILNKDSLSLNLVSILGIHRWKLCCTE